MLTSRKKITEAITISVEMALDVMSPFVLVSAALSSLYTIPELGITISEETMISGFLDEDDDNNKQVFHIERFRTSSKYQLKLISIIILKKVSF